MSDAIETKSGPVIIPLDTSTDMLMITIIGGFIGVIIAIGIVGLLILKKR